VAQEMPCEFYRELSGGILLKPEAKLHRHSLPVHDLYILGEYHYDSLGRYIVLYYQSFAYVYGHLPGEALKHQIRQTVKHEFTHHLESLAGERELEVKDAQSLWRYRRQHGGLGGGGDGT